MAVSASDHDALRMQIERGLEEDRRRRRMRAGVIAAAAMLAVSLLVNLAVLTAPGSLGLATSGDVTRAGDALRAEVSAARRTQAAEAAALTATTRRAAARADKARTAARTPAPSVCATLTALGDWSFIAGRRPATGCAPRR